MKLAFCFAAFFLAVQLLLWAPFLRRFIALLLQEHGSLHFKGWGFLLPFFCFSVRDFRFLYHGSLEQDRFYIEAKRVRFCLIPFFYVLGRLRLNRLYFKKPLLHYFNRQDSYKKSSCCLLRPFSDQEYVCRTADGSVYIEDDTVWPVYARSKEYTDP